MFDLDTDDRLTAWSELRKAIDLSNEPLQTCVDFWFKVPFVPFNKSVDPFYPASWPTPWEIIVQNQYDDFTKAVMMGYTLLLTERYKNSLVEIKTLVDSKQNRLYNVVYIDNTWVLNFDDYRPTVVDSVPSLYRLENLVELKRPR